MQEPTLHPAQLSVEQLLMDCDIQRTRRSGPGGQHRNKVETAVVITHRPTGVRAEASERRSQDLNRKQAVFRLRVKLALQVRGQVESKRSEAWKKHVSGGRLSVSRSHDNLPALLAEALDVIAENSYAVADAAALLGISTSQLVKFLKIEPAGLALVNRERQSRGEPNLR